MKKLLYPIVIFLLSITTGFSQNDTINPIRKIPSLNGHIFQTSSNLRSSFIATSLQAKMGAGITSKLKIPGIMIGDNEIFAFEGQILFVDLGVQYQQKFNSWLAFYATFNMAGRLGTDMSTIVADGVNTITGGEIGWLFRIKQTKKLNLSGTASIFNLTGNFINVSQYFQEIIDGNPYPSVVKKVPAMSAALGLRGAYAFNPTFGLQMQFDYAYGESFNRGKTKGYFSGGIIGDIDFNPKYNVPIGFGIGYTISSAPEVVMNEGGASNLFLAKIGYTGARDFDIGIQYTYYDVEIKSIDDTPFISKVLLLLKFYF